jgi:hypothetical protein
MQQAMTQNLPIQSPSLSDDLDYHMSHDAQAASAVNDLDHTLPVTEINLTVIQSQSQHNSMVRVCWPGALTNMTAGPGIMLSLDSLNPLPESLSKAGSRLPEAQPDCTEILSTEYY